VTLDHAARQLSLISARVATYCDHAEHLEATDRSEIIAAGSDLRNLSAELAAEGGIDLAGAYRRRLEMVEQRHPLYPAGGYAAIDQIPDHGATWHLLQTVQWEHDRRYHPDVLGLSRYEQLRHYAFHLAKLAGAATQAVDGSSTDFYGRRLADILLFGLKLATLMSERLDDESVN
jgi:hypothetical protein